MLHLHWQSLCKTIQKMHRTATAATLALANLGDVTQIELVLSEAYNVILHHTRLQKESVVAYAVMEGFIGSFTAHFVSLLFSLLEGALVQLII